MGCKRCGKECKVDNVYCSQECVSLFEKEARLLYERQLLAKRARVEKLKKKGVGGLVLDGQKNALEQVVDKVNEVVDVLNDREGLA